MSKPAPSSPPGEARSAPAQPSAGSAPPVPSVVRRGLLWWFSPPADPYLVVNFSLDMTAARAYLARLNGRPGGARVTVNHLVCAAVARTLAVWPSANAQVRGRRIIPRPHVGVAMPVNLLDTPVGARRELSATILPAAETLSLRAVAEASSRAFTAERADAVENPLFRHLMTGFERLPDPLMVALLNGLDRGRHRRFVSELLFRAAPITTGITNPGAGFRAIDGMLFKGGALTLPPRLFHIGTLWAVMPVQDEVVAHRGQPAIRPMLPMMLLFDHRLLDGVMGGRVVSSFSSFILDPVAEFGDDGARIPSATPEIPRPSPVD
jgi:hypothetical protein